jgi:hypothetical protein
VRRREDLRLPPPSTTKALAGGPSYREAKGGYVPYAPSDTITVYNGAMPASKQVRRSITLPLQVAKQVDNMAKRRRLSDNRVLVELIEEGIEAQKKKEKAFFELAERFRAAKDPEEIKRLGDNLGRFVFGDFHP